MLLVQYVSAEGALTIFMEVLCNSVATAERNGLFIKVIHFKAGEQH
jgi:hypothetical protein